MGRRGEPTPNRCSRRIKVIIEGGVKRRNTNRGRPGGPDVEHFCKSLEANRWRRYHTQATRFRSPE